MIARNPTVTAKTATAATQPIAFSGCTFVRALNDLTPITSLDEGIGGFLDTVKAMGRVVPDSH
jgi:hypothetical protein